MKKTDIAMIVLIAGISVVASYFAMNAWLGDPSEKKAEVKTMEVVSSEFVQPNNEIFNKSAINPTVEIVIGEDGEKTY